MIKTAILKNLAFFSSFLALSACSFDMRSASEKYPSISKTRPLNSSCGKTDSASVKREAQHPLGPTGGWLSPDLTKVDYEKVMPDTTNYLAMKNGVISGYVKFEKPGYLQARSYDDYYGDVYCGWSDQKIHLKKVDEPVFVSISTCSVGDGGLDQIHEVAWFPEGASEGILVFSSAYPQNQSKILASDLYQKELLGNQYSFGSQYARDALHASLIKGDLNLARQIVSDSFSNLSGLKNLMDSKTQTQIKSRDYHADDWAMILSYSLGLEIDSPDFERDMKEMLDIVAGPGNSSYRHTNCQIQKNMSPVYTWLHQSIMNKKKAILPQLTDPNQNIYGYNPIAIVEYLSGKLTKEKFLQVGYPNQDFWLGVEAYLARKKDLAKLHLQKYQKERKPTEHGFEPACSAILLERLSD
ncbi:MAG: hypothetical protein SFY67_00370 [Candidatus Melainabacteria bacterium]|nr:hypothetical protein [Candidatus Melainabacteria bacterium]